MTETSLIVEIIAGILSSILLATSYKLWRYFKKNSLCFLNYDTESNEYVITNDKQEQILSINLEKLNLQNEKLQQQIKILEKSKSIYERNKLDKLIKYQEPNNIIDIELNEIKE